ncbi:unnamed protein product [Vitrella brassicaformis CCMP3155]|uniref:Anaphase-promoting complex subunit 4 WD40 domain-containing protein n=1 Tax=Vitrella brassicaformis (strain CCMP3155) TaxID=1169540 RepID=A0A0G4EME8_VITBC|nr:unnamed protein product [Vitrella brassicaformis CCMP3155]|eukprot:CEL98138.1 unnamed protein product [Vitrella brassicaformis CCMP3155]
MGASHRAVVEAAMELERVAGWNARPRWPVAADPRNGTAYAVGVGAVVVYSYNGTEQVSYEGHDDMVSCLAFAHGTHDPDKALLASGQVGANADVIVWTVGAPDKRDDHPPLKYRFSEHDGGIRDLCWSHDDKVLMTLGEDQRLFFWDMQTGGIVCWLPAPPCTAVVASCGISVRDVKGRVLPAMYQFAVCGGRTVDFISLKKPTGAAERFDVAGSQKREWLSLAFDASGELLFAGSQSGDIHVVLVKTRALLYSVSVCSRGVRSLVAMPTDKLLCGGGDGSLTMLTIMPEDVQLKEESHMMVSDTAAVVHIEGRQDPSPGLQVVLVACSDGTISSLLLPAFRQTIVSHALGESNGRACGVTGMCFGAEPDKVWTSDDGGLLTLWELPTFEKKMIIQMRGSGKKSSCATLKAVPPLHSGRSGVLDSDSSDLYPTAIAAAPNSCVVASGYNEGTVRMFDCRPETVGRRELWHLDRITNGAVASIAVAANNRFTMAGSSDGTINVIETKTRTVISTLREQPKLRCAVLFNGDSCVACVGGASLLVYDLRSERRVASHHMRDGNFWSCCARDGPENPLIATSSQGGKLEVFDMRDGLRPCREFQSASETYAVDVSPSRDLLCGAAGRGEVNLWSIASGALLETKTHDCAADVAGLQFAADGKQAVMAGGGTIACYNVFAS